MDFNAAHIGFVEASYALTVVSLLVLIGFVIRVDGKLSKDVAMIKNKTDNN
jgi:hypothetical protein